MDPFYYDYYDYGMDAAESIGLAGGFLSMFVGFYFLIIFGSIAISLASYILQSLGYYTIANRRGIKNAWLAWIPIGVIWILGSISDQYQYVTKGRTKNRRKLLLGLSIGIFVFYILWVIVMIIATAMTMAPTGTGLAFVGLITIFGVLGIFAIAIASAILQYMCMYDLYRSCNPENSVLFLVLSIVVSWLAPILVFACRNKDLGMPPRRRPNPQPAYTAPQAQPVVDVPVAEPPVEEPSTADNSAAPQEEQ